MQFDLKEQEIITEIQTHNYKRIVLQFPEGDVCIITPPKNDVKKKEPSID